MASIHKPSVVRYLINAIASLGVEKCFGVPGDYSFTLVDEFFKKDSPIKWVSCCNELNAGYAADGYARMRGFSCLCTTFAVGELSALNAIAGAYAESCPVIHIVGMPSSKIIEKKLIMHHAIGTSDWDYTACKKIYDNVTIASAILTPKNTVAEVFRVLRKAYKERRPVYFAIPSNFADEEIIIDESIKNEYQIEKIQEPIKSDQRTLNAALKELERVIINSKTCVLFPGYMTRRLNVLKEVLDLIAKLNLPYATMLMDKSCLSETSSHYIGVYEGSVVNPKTKQFVEESDLILSIGALFTDFNTGMFSANLKKENLVDIQSHYVKIGYAKYEGVEMADILSALTKSEALKNKKFDFDKEHLLAKSLKEITEDPSSNFDNHECNCQECVKYPIKSNDLFVALEEFFQQDIIFAETGTASFGLGLVKLNQCSFFISEALYGSIGYTLPASFGAAMELVTETESCKSLVCDQLHEITSYNRRIVCVIGDGSLQLTAQELCSFSRYNLHPIIIVLDNDGYTIERMLCKPEHKDTSYNDIKHWRYEKLPEAFGCANEWISTVVCTTNELKEALKKTRDNVEKSSLIVVRLPRHSMPMLLSGFIRSRNEKKSPIILSPILSED